MATNKTAPDWPAIKADYLSGSESVRNIAEMYSVTEGAIRKRAKAEGWPPRPKQVRKAVSRVPAMRTAPVSPPRDRAAPAPVDAGAIADHGRALVDRMLDELDTVTSHVGELEEMIEAETADDTDGKRRDAMLGAISLGGRAKTLKELSTALKTLNDAAAPAQGKKAAAQQAASELAGSSRFRPVGKPALSVVKQ